MESAPVDVRRCIVLCILDRILFYIIIIILFILGLLYFGFLVFRTQDSGRINHP
jgi:hypothetical protein